MCWDPRKTPLNSVAERSLSVAPPTSTTALAPSLPISSLPLCATPPSAPIYSASNRQGRRTSLRSVLATDTFGWIASQLHDSGEPAVIAAPVGKGLIWTNIVSSGDPDGSKMRQKSETAADLPDGPDLTVAQMMLANPCSGRPAAASSILSGRRTPRAGGRSGGCVSRSLPANHPRFSGRGRSLSPCRRTRRRRPCGPGRRRWWPSAPPRGSAQSTGPPRPRNAEPP